MLSPAIVSSETLYRYNKDLTAYHQLVTGGLSHNSTIHLRQSLIRQTVEMTNEAIKYALDDPRVVGWLAAGDTDAVQLYEVKIKLMKLTHDIVQMKNKSSRQVLQQLERYFGYIKAMRHKHALDGVPAAS